MVDTTTTLTWHLVASTYETIRGTNDSEGHVIPVTAEHPAMTTITEPASSHLNDSADHWTPGGVTLGHSWTDFDVYNDTGTLNNSVQGNDTMGGGWQDWGTSTAILITYVVIGVVGVLGNLLVVVVIFNYTSMRKRVTNLFLINQSMVDLFASVVMIATSVTHLHTQWIPTYEGLAGEIYCRVWESQSILWALLFSSTYNLVAVNIERYFEIVYPILHKVAFTKAKAYICIAVVWLSGMVFVLSSNIPVSEARNGICFLNQIWPSRQVQVFVGVLSFFLQYLLPIVIMLYCYTSMALTIKKRIAPRHQPQYENAGQGRNGNTSELGSTISQDMMTKAKKNIIKTLFIVSLCFVACWTFNQIFFLLFNLGLPLNIQSTFSHFSVIAVFCNCCLNPFVYAAKYRQFQDGLRLLFGKKNTVEPSTTTND